MILVCVGQVSMRQNGGKRTDGLLKSSSSVTSPNISHAKPAKKNRKLFSNISNVS